MKKIFLSLALIFAFGTYVFYKNTQANNETVISQPSVSNTLSSTPIPASSDSPSISELKDGKYTGDRTDAFYGFIQVKAIIQGGKITDVEFLEYPNDRRTSIEISNQSLPELKSEAISAQSAQVDIVSGATQTSDAFNLSLQSALNKAKN